MALAYSSGAQADCYNDTECAHCLMRSGGASGIATCSAGTCRQRRRCVDAPAAHYSSSHHVAQLIALRCARDHPCRLRSATGQLLNNATAFAREARSASRYLSAHVQRSSVLLILHVRAPTDAHRCCARPRITAIILLPRYDTDQLPVARAMLWEHHLLLVLPLRADKGPKRLRACSCA